MDTPACSATSKIVVLPGRVSRAIFASVPVGGASQAAPALKAIMALTMSSK